MALPQLSDEQVRTWTREEKDRWWLENVFRGDMPQLTLRAAVTGFLVGGILSATNLYIGAKTGWTLGVGVTSVIISFVVFRALARIGLIQDLTILENNAVQSIATAAGYMTGPLISALMAYMFITNKPMEMHQMVLWNILASILGVLVAFPMKRRFINDEQQPFPEGRAAAVVLDSLYPDAPRGGTLHMRDNMPVQRPRTATDGGVDMGVFKAKALAWAAAIGATLQLLVAGGYMALLQIRLLGSAKSKETLWKIPERLDEWYYHLAAKGKATLPRINGLSFEQLGVTLAFDLSMIGAGGLMGMRIANSLVLGMVANFLVVAPLMIRAGEIVPKNLKQIAQADGTYDAALAVFGRPHLTNSWCLWWGVAMMVTASMVGLFAKPKVLLSAFGGLFNLGDSGPKREDCLKHVELPLSWSFVGIPVFSAIIIWLNWAWFDVNPWLGALSIPLIIVLTLIAANATALTSTTPTGSLSKITQFTFGSLQPTNPGTNLMTAGVTTEVASNASNLLMDIKPGYMLGAKPRQQAWGHCIGIVAGALASTPLFYLLFLNKWKPEGPSIETTITDQWAVPGAIQWAAISKVIEGMGKSGTMESSIITVDGIDKLWGVLPVSAAWAMLAGAVLALLLEVARIARRGRFPISAVGLGLGVVLPPESTIMMWIGAALFTFYERKYHERVGQFGHRLWVESKEAVCAGLIAGWALLGIGDGIIAAVTEFPETEAEVAALEKAAAAAPAATTASSEATPAAESSGTSATTPAPAPAPAAAPVTEGASSSNTASAAAAEGTTAAASEAAATAASSAASTAPEPAPAPQPTPAAATASPATAPPAVITTGWGFDRNVENGRRMDWVSESLREWQAVHGAPPAALTQLPTWPSNLLDMFGTPIEYRVSGSPARWEIRSAGADRRFDDQDLKRTGP